MRTLVETLHSETGRCTRYLADKGPTLVIEVDGTEVARLGPQPLAQMIAGLVARKGGRDAQTPG